MQHTKGSESPELGRSISRSRSTSMSSDSQLPRLHLLSPPPVNPAPCFIASSAAAEIITADQEFNTADFVTNEEDAGADASALITPEALIALNGFLDHLLFNILATAKSTQLTCIRPAIAEVLKPRLAKEVVSAADEELSEYMGGEEDEQSEFRGGQSPTTDFDLIRSWKLTRLRCMVYTRLGDMEEDDEDEYIAQDGLVETGEGIPARFTSHVGNITPAAAIFLTSIIEHIGEQALIIAGETARSRLSLKLGDDHDEVTESGAERSSLDRLVVEELDMEKLALNPTLGRLWRTWRRRVRTRSLSRTVSRESIPRRRLTVASVSSRKSSTAGIDDPQPQMPVPSVQVSRKELDPASISLPMSEHDIDEIEIPGFISDLDGSEVHEIHEVQTMQAVVAHKVRPHSLMVLTLASPRSPSSNGNSPVTPGSAQSTRSTRHVRSRSLPGSPVLQEDTSCSDEVAEGVSPTEEQKRLETMYERDEDDKHSRPRKLGQSSHARGLPADSPADEPTGPAACPEAVTTSSLSAASMDAVTSQASTTDLSSASVSDYQDSRSEIIEGHGLFEKPTLAPLQRPKRMGSKDPTRSTPSSPARESPSQAEEANEAHVQGQVAKSSASRPAVNLDASWLSDEDASGPEAGLPERSASAGSSSTRATPLPADIPIKKVGQPVSTPGENSRSDRPRTRPIPAPLSLVSVAQQSFGRTSPALSTPGSSITERAAVQRLSRPSPSTASSTYSRSCRSDSIGSCRVTRPLTAGSTTSQVSSKIKGLIGRQTESAAHTLRSSSDTGRASAATGDSVDDDKSALDDLIQSEETIHYTLTPKSVRDIEEMDFPARRPSRTATSDLAEFFKDTAPPGTEVPRPKASKSSSKSNIDLSPIAKSNSADRSKFRSIPATDADLAEKPKSYTRSNGPRLEARSAVSPRGDETSELIKFLLEGPPDSGAHQVARTTAPSQDTLASTDLRKRIPSVASTQEGSMATRSLTSIGSHTALLDSATRSTAQTDVALRTATSSSSTPVEAQPVRKPRRVRDPYAIDDSDDDELLEDLLQSSKPKREEESLMDFLRNVPPPDFDPQPVPIQAPLTRSPSTSFGSASAMKARLLRNTSFDKSLSMKSSRSSLRQQSDNHAMGPSNYTVKGGMEYNGGAIHAGYGLSTVSEKQTETSALASFLRNTGPPEPPASRPMSTSKKDLSSFSRLFGRRKKVEA
ncbi:uncharacterized protein ACLA_052180 [Aspergillus clavatus NRRL 1]|uniref:Uncharacterized protein n=1 Tax=Aspergillus clavatus (strain ATCC 1007 / CBS 513.65 / DSM 816 / NCTC 3887 / NRRL 1 / QM 1276 / 107) TaxID=344612 RepID=A1CIP1_ASPCL|nr:uncharacterized protein ACLA_052180 [Aspergillus clavatus NRRL 1]EAW10746.1 conserved hypothetical protein [Aspergillus clavatus NRRL 1]